MSRGISPPPSLSPWPHLLVIGRRTSPLTRFRVPIVSPCSTLICKRRLVTSIINRGVGPVMVPPGLRLVVWVWSQLITPIVLSGVVALRSTRSLCLNHTPIPFRSPLIRFTVYLFIGTVRNHTPFTSCMI